MITQVCRYTRAFGCSLPWTPGTGFLALVLTAGLVFPVTATAGECPRIVSQSPYITHSLEYLGLASCIVGASRYDDLDVEDTGGILDPDAQAISRVEPDLAFTSSWVERDDWADTVPAGTRAIVLGGFEGMDAVRENLERIADAAGLDDGAVRAAEFDDAWQEAADAVGASGERAVLMSSCSAQAYVYGPKTWLHDAFTRAGFDVVANQSGVHHLRLSEDTDELADLINQYDADVVFTFSGSEARSCRAVVASSPVRVVSLPSGYFSHPAPVILDGLAELQTRHTEWAEAQ
ncbi:ABC transporter substrate-binding protein [Thioalkalivibrio sp. ALE17]|uniref:ABC transporter substrate-binding protein n=1 Tax=Thioalkalivibrio sp. ALE17 TaxID=1158173 RepID=UPI00048CB5CE|nr:hypothetical protein [Thioalkalivibrio sp. ALE17]